MPPTCWDRANLPPLGLLWRFGGRWRWLMGGLVLACAGTLPSVPNLGVALACAALVLAWMFRSPRRRLPLRGTVVAPADGIVDDVEEMDSSPFLPGKVLRIGIFLSLTDPHATRAPISGVVERVMSIAGNHRSALARDAGHGNQRIEIWLAGAGGRRLCLRQIAGRIARRAVFGPRPGDTVEGGALVGMIRFGSRVEMFLPLAAYCMHVTYGMRVSAGETVLGVLGNAADVSKSAPRATPAHGACRHGDSPEAPASERR